MAFRNLPPDPYLFVKSIAEQGYSLSTAISDLIDNSIAAKASRVELLFDFDHDPFTVFIADNGEGMTEKALIQNLRFPSRDSEASRDPSDLGRFGLGLKTASFSQTRRFTVISKSGEKDYSSCTWDLNHLKIGEWELIVNSRSQTHKLVSWFLKLNKCYLDSDKSFVPKTIILWEGLYKIERFDGSHEEKKAAISSEINEETTEHLGLVFHRFLQDHRLAIRVNNDLIKPFDPFPENVNDLRFLSPRLKEYKDENITMQGIVLPARSIKESREGINIWTLPKRSLTDMEGIYVYRNDRLIVSGGWNRLIRKSPQFQLGRIMVEIGNKSDELFQLNVSKSSLKIPYEIRRSFLTVIAEIKAESFKEYRNRINHEFIKESSKKGQTPILDRVYTAAGYEYKINEKHPLYKLLVEDYDSNKTKILKDYLQRINKQINDMVGLDERVSGIKVETDESVIKEDIGFYIQRFKTKGFNDTSIKKELETMFNQKQLIAELLNKK